MKKKTNNEALTAYDTMVKLGIKFCPICKKEFQDYPSISRKDNKMEICPECGMKEALDDFKNYLLKK